ncbi:hypothetical protein [Pseudovibrio denitrificans]|uniref:hypothetical protein n=1 Tax=Pseudovibrio denitrificans TaxID=258256 RepID=UPI000AE11679|nr:hypothetical protein [Pseudovibrio denitrificans]
MADFVHVEWGRNASSDGYAATVIVDCLSFSTATGVACGRGALVVPVADREEGQKLAVEIGGVCAQAPGRRAFAVATNTDGAVCR